MRIYPRWLVINICCLTTVGIVRITAINIRDPIYVSINIIPTHIIHLEIIYLVLVGLHIKKEILLVLRHKYYWADTAHQKEDPILLLIEARQLKEKTDHYGDHAPQ